MRKLTVLLAALALVALAGQPASAYQRPGANELVSLRHDGSQPNTAAFGASAWGPAITPEGRYVAFAFDDWLTPDDNSGALDVYVRDRQAGAIELVSKSTSGGGGSGSSQTPALSDDGRYVAFESLARNLVTSDTNNAWDVFVRDRQTQTTRIASLATSGAQGDSSSTWPSISADGRYVAFASLASNLAASDTNPFGDVYVRDLQTGTTEMASVSSEEVQGQGDSYQPSISGDGRYVAFTSSASNLVVGDTNGEIDVFVRDRVAGTTERVSVASNGTEGHGHYYGSYLPAISATGRHVAFTSYSTNLVPWDTNLSTDIFVRDRETGVTERITVSSRGTETTPHPTDPQPGCTICVGRTRADSAFSDISADGRYVVYMSEAADLVPGDTNNRLFDTFVRDRVMGTTERVSVSPAGAEPRTGSSNYRPAITDDGRLVAFIDSGEGLGPPGTIQYYHVYLRDRVATSASGAFRPRPRTGG